ALVERLGVALEGVVRQIDRRADLRPARICGQRQQHRLPPVGQVLDQYAGPASMARGPLAALPQPACRRTWEDGLGGDNLTRLDQVPLFLVGRERACRSLPKQGTSC